MIILYFKVKDTNKVIESLSLEDIQWLTKFHVIRRGNTGYIKDDGVETLPFFDDYEISYNDAVSMNNFSKNNIENMQHTRGFKSKSLEKFCTIIETILKTKKGLNVFCS